MKTPDASGAVLLRWLRLLALAVGLGLCGAASAAPGEEEIAQGVIFRMEHVSVDYPFIVRGGEVLDGAEYQGLQEFASQAEALLAQLPPRPEQAALLAQARRVRAAMESRADAAEVAGAARTLGADLLRIYRLTPAPRQTPNLRRAQALFQQECAVCHGRDGRGDGPVAASLQPPPGDFLDTAHMERRSILQLYDAITTGLRGQPGHGAHLPFGDRWALAFLVSGLRDPPETVRYGEALWREGQGQAQLPDLRALVLRSPAEIEQEGGSALAAVRAFLTTHPEVLETSRPAGLVLARTKLREAVSAYVAGEVARSRELAAAAHAEGLVPLATRLDQADPALRSEIERELLALGSAIEGRARVGTVAAHATRIERLLDRAADLLARNAQAAKAVYVSSLLILLREGIETILLLATMGALVRKTGRPEAMRYIHAGWIAAVPLGLATWFAAGELLAMTGAGHELTEGVSALIAAAMLLYVGFWLHKRADLEAWEAFVRAQVTAALGRRTLWAMAGVAFLACYRELFEIVLLYQVLSAQAGTEGHRAVVGGVATAAVLLAALAWFIVKYGARLPVARFHAASSALLVLMALVFVGHGIAALQHADVVPVTAVRFVAVPVLGIHPTAQGLATQVLVAALIAAGILRNRRQRQR